MKELKHYLGTDLKVQVISKGETVIGTMSGVYSDGTIICHDVVESDHTTYKPFLHPLSDLITLGKENTPINEHTINMLIGENETYGKVTLSYYKGAISVDIESEDYSNNENIYLKVFQTIQEQLFKGHYDIYGWIEKGLAIDINTLK